MKYFKFILIVFLILFLVFGYIINTELEPRELVLNGDYKSDSYFLNPIIYGDKEIVVAGMGREHSGIGRDYIDVTVYDILDESEKSKIGIQQRHIPEKVVKGEEKIINGVKISVVEVQQIDSDLVAKIRFEMN